MDRPAREMTLDEWVDRLPTEHRARRDLAEARRQLAEATRRADAAEGKWLMEKLDRMGAEVSRDEAAEDLAEAAEAVRLLIAVLQLAGPPAPWQSERPVVRAYHALPAWLRREIER